MKKLKIILKVLLFVALVAPWASCSKSDDNAPDDGKDKDPYMEVCEHVADVANKVKNQYFKESNDIGELASHAEEIKKMEYVNDVYFSYNTMFVDIEGYGPIFYTYFPKENIEEIEHAGAQMQKFLKTMKTRADGETPAKYLNGYETAVIANQQYNEDRQWARDAATIAQKSLENCGIKVESTPDITPTVEFFQNELFDYDIVFFIGHGMWDPKRELHWLATSSEVTSKDYKDFYADDLYEYRGYSRDQVTFGFNSDESLDGKKSYYVNVFISETHIKNAPRDFKKKGDVIFFNVACQSMMGGIPREEDENLRSYSLAQVFNNKGVGFYLGFDEISNSGAQFGGMAFLAGISAGMSLRAAYETLPNNYLRQKNTDKELVFKQHLAWSWSLIEDYVEKERVFIADMLPFPLYSDVVPGISNRYVVSPVVESCNDESTEAEIEVTLNATSPLYYDTGFINSLLSVGKKVDASKAFFYSFEPDLKFAYGFEYSTNEEFTDAKRTDGMAVNTAGCEFAEGRVSFTQTLTGTELKSNTTYYFRAYIYDGYGYNYSKPKSFKTKTLFGGDGTVPDIPGTDF